MKLNTVGRSPVGIITIGLFLAVAIATLDQAGGTFLFVVLCFSLIVLIPLASLIRTACLRGGMRPWPRRTLMLVPVVILCLFVFYGTNGFGGYQRQLLRHGMAGRLPSNMKVIQYEGHSGLMAEICFTVVRCDPASLRQIVRSAPFVEVTDEWTRNRPRRLALPQAQTGELICFERGDWKKRFPGGIPKCDIVTDSTFTWAYIDYRAGD